MKTTQRFLLTLCAAALGAACSGGAAVQPAAPVVLAEGITGNPTVAWDAAGETAYAVWIETRENVSDVWFTRLDEPDAVPVRVNDIPGDAAPHEQAPAQVRAGPDGTVYVVWQNNLHIPGRRFPASNLRLARSIDGGRTWEPAIYVNDDAQDLPASHTFHDIAVAGDGTVFVSWIDGRVRARAEAALAAAGGPAVSGTHAPHGGHGGHGGHGADLPGSQVRIARSTDGGRTFGENIVVHENVCPCCRTSLAIAPDGRIYLSFRSADDNVRDIMVRHSTDGGQSFSAPVPVHRDGWVIDGCPHAGASLAVDGNGALHVAWYTGEEERQGVWYARSEDGGNSFAAPVAVQAGGWVPVSQVRLAVANGGDVWLSWEDRRHEERQVHLARVRGNRLLPVAGVDAGGFSPALAAASSLVLAWQTETGVSARTVTLR